VLNEPFPINSWTLGGEGHIVWRKRLVLGGRFFGTTHPREVVDPLNPGRTMQVTCGLGLGQLGFNLLPENKLGWKLYPQLGLGLSSFILQSKQIYDGDPVQQSVVNVLATGNDNMAIIQKMGVAVDFGVGFDWYKPFKNFFTIVPGLDVGIMFRLEAGWTYVPANTYWKREIDDLTDYAPETKFDGLYVHAGFGLGLSPK